MINAKEVHRRMDQAEKKILALADQRADIQFAIDYFTMRSEKYEVISELVQSKRTPDTFWPKKQML